MNATSFQSWIRRLATIVLPLLALGFAQPVQAAPERYPYKVVTTVGMITDIVRNVAGDKAEVEGLIGEGVDPHLYKPTRRDLVALRQANVVFYNGLMLEGKMADVLLKIARQKPVYAVTEGISELSAEEVETLRDELEINNALYQAMMRRLQNEAAAADSTSDPAVHDLHTRTESQREKVEELRAQLNQAAISILTNGEKHYDPHVWMDVRGWISATWTVTKGLVEYDPANKAYYRKRALAYIAQLEQLDAYAREVLDSIPEQQRYLVTAHDAFNYLGRAYGIEVRGIQGLSTESEAGVRDIEKLVDFLVRNKIPAVFIETSVSDKNVRALVEGAAARGHKLIIGGELYSDAMGAPGSYEGTYIGMIDHNTTTIARALGGQAPAKGMNGKLSGSK